MALIVSSAGITESALSLCSLMMLLCNLSRVRGLKFEGGSLVLRNVLTHTCAHTHTHTHTHAHTLCKYSKTECSNIATLQLMIYIPLQICSLLKLQTVVRSEVCVCVCVCLVHMFMDVCYTLISCVCICACPCVCGFCITL